MDAMELRVVDHLHVVRLSHAHQLVRQLRPAHHLRHAVRPSQGVDAVLREEHNLAAVAVAPGASADDADGAGQVVELAPVCRVAAKHPKLTVIAEHKVVVAVRAKRAYRFSNRSRQAALSGNGDADVIAVYGRVDGVAPVIRVPCP